MKITYRENALTAEDFNLLKKSVGFLEKPLLQVEKALQNGLFSIAAFNNEKIIGMGRLVGDGSMYWYVQDLVILPQYQSQGIGKEIMNHLLKFVADNSQPGTKVTIGLMAAKGKEGFYKKLGFRSRPNEKEDAGMIMIIDVE